MTAPPSLSAVIATRDRPSLLSGCLESLEQQQLEQGQRLEVIVVDDGSGPAVRAVVDEHAGRLGDLHYVRQEPAGLQAARNHGALASRGLIIAYLDDDTLMPPGWAAAVMKAFDTWGCQALAGRITLALPRPAPPWLQGRMWRYLSELELGDKPLWLEGRELPYGANCAVRRDVFEVLGGFRSKLGRSGGSLLSHEDTDFFSRVREYGGKIAYAPEARVFHVVTEERLDLGWFRRRAFAQGQSDVVRASGRRDEGSGRVVRLLREALGLTRLMAEGARDILLDRPFIGAGIYLCYWRGRWTATRSGG